MHSRTIAWVLSLVGLALLVPVCWKLISSIEFDVTVYTSDSIRARRNPYLAAQIFMQESGINVVEAGSLVGLNTLEGVATVLIAGANQVVNPHQLEQVLIWLKKGGAMIVTANASTSSDDLLLKEFNVEMQWADRDQAVNDGGMTRIDFGDDIGILEIEFNWYKVLTHPHVEGKDVDDSVPQPLSWSSSDSGIQMMRFNVGDGLLTIISDLTIWTSNKIGYYDHAYLLWILSAKTGDFAILHPTPRDSIWHDSIWQLMLRNAPELLIALALTIVLWLWHLGHRFGRIIPHDTSGGRALSEHFSATANYLWQRKASDKLIEPIRAQILRRACILLPGFANASNDPQTQLQLIGQHCGIEVANVDIALHAAEFNEASFVRTVKLLKYIKQSL